MRAPECRAIVVACQTDTWEKVSGSSLRSARDRFDVLPELGAIPDADTAAAIVSARFAPYFEQAKFKPTYPTWPIAVSALDEAPHAYTARRLLMRLADHVTGCVAAHRATEMTTLDQPEGPAPENGDAVMLTSGKAQVGELFERLLAVAEGGGMAASEEDHAMPRLIGAGLRSLVHELDVDPHSFQVDEDFGRSAELHARLRHVAEEGTGQEVHWAFRAIAAADARAFQSRLAKAIRASELASDQPHRHLLVIRNVSYPGGPKTDELRRDFASRGGRDLVLNGGDLRTLSAIRALLDHHPQGLQEWLRAGPEDGTSTRKWARPACPPYTGCLLRRH